MGDISTVIERLRALTGPDRKVDGDIACAIGLLHPRDFTTPTSSIPSAPTYTASLDAARTLLPPNSGYGTWRVIGKPPNAAIQSPDGEWSDYQSGQTEAIAFCIAALKAREGTTHEG